VLSASASSFRLMAENAGVLLEESIDPDLPHINGDGVRLRQVFTNLISNALKFTRDGGTVEVSAQARGDILHATVRDTGVGMTSEEVSVALTPFGQVDASHARWREGTGLGLPIACALVRLHGGELSIRSEKGKGTSVEVRFPILADDAQDGATHQERAL
jgi:two-component system, cell cycle sensor histidine kinase PleC